MLGSLWGGFIVVDSDQNDILLFEFFVEFGEGGHLGAAGFVAGGREVQNDDFAFVGDKADIGCGVNWKRRRGKGGWRFRREAGSGTGGHGSWIRI